MFSLVMQSHNKAELARKVAEKVLVEGYQVLCPIKEIRRELKHFKKRSNGTFRFSELEENSIFMVKVGRAD